MRNPFYLMITVLRKNDAVLSVDSYSTLRAAKGQRTRVRKSGYYDAKLFEATYALGCIAAREIEV